MSRTIRRKHQRYEYVWVLKDWELFFSGRPNVRHDQHSPAGRKAIAIFHSDKEVTMGSSAPHWYRKIFERQRRTRNNREMRKWLNNPSFDPVFECRHRHDANWAWW
ncbi:hypothetical protein [Polynucleobacter sp. MWH-UH25E]|uniref:hypothetical protein n=1 Tax=Polynucleobacter sp. MWH-UH25E TaxID=1855616 RepID=UPI001BFD902B|nr:hypothetical protein [Polynucleobacter sp. MWH-UH25E]QWD62384.1 hypothetical protein ICV39_01840 [Polynucleobacter sp. MWH-UH25E]